jgi:hypothetical protein
MTNGKKLLSTLFLLTVFFFAQTKVFAKSSYVLPYPSTMPGNSLYKVHVVYEELLKFWYFGSFGAFDYNLRESDKYLVEAKTLFEYNQYLLGYQSLKKSDSYFVKILPSLSSAKNQGKDISEKLTLLHDASGKHMEVLTSLKPALPEVFVWRPEKANPVNLNLSDEIESSLRIRQAGL